MPRASVAITRRTNTVNIADGIKKQKRALLAYTVKSQLPGLSQV